MNKSINHEIMKLIMKIEKNGISKWRNGIINEMK